jgi:prolyl-tRNA synthetase
MFADMDLIGLPHRLVLSERGLDAGRVEYKARDAEASQDVALEDVVAFLAERIAQA